MTRTIRFSILLLVLGPTTVFAQTEAPASHHQPVAGQVRITSAPNGTTTYDDATGIAHITKDVVVTQQDENLILEGQQVTYSNKLNQATLTGPVRVRTLSSSMDAQKALADFDKQRLTLSGQVTITSHGKDDGLAVQQGKEANKKPVRIVCDQVQWDYNTGQATATGNVQFFLGNSKGTCHKLVYDEAKNTLLLSGDPELNAQTRIVKGEDMRINVEENTVIGGKRMNVRFLPKTPTA